MTTDAAVRPVESEDFAVGSNIKSPGSFWLSSRFGFAVIAFLGFVNLYALRVNLSVAIVCMLNHTALHQHETAENGRGIVTLVNGSLTSESECISSFSLNNTKQLNGEFVWTKSQTSLLLGAFFWGYLVTQIPGGQLAERFGGKYIYGLCMAVAAIATLLCPFSAQKSYIALIFMRIVIGLCEGVAYPTMHTMWANWAPPLERSRLVGFSYSGNQIGNIIALCLAALICDAAGWPTVFYVFGSLGLIWCAIWLLLVSNTPAEHKRMSKEELEFIEVSLATQIDGHHGHHGHHERDGDHGHHGHHGKGTKTPWLSILTSMPTWAIIVGHTTANFGTNLMMTYLPTFMAEVLNFNIRANGLLSSIPYVAYYLGINSAAFLADYLRKNQILTTGQVRKTMMILALFGQAGFFLGAAYCSCGEEMLTVVLITLAQGFSGLQYAGYVVNHVDIAPRYAGTLFGISNTIAAVFGFVPPAIVAALTPNHSREEWRLVFWVAAGILSAGATFFAVFASGEVQPWAVPKKLQDEIEMKVASKSAVESEKKPAAK